MSSGLEEGEITGASPFFLDISNNRKQTISWSENNRMNVFNNSINRYCAISMISALYSYLRKADRKEEAISEEKRVFLACNSYNCQYNAHFSWRLCCGVRVQCCHGHRRVMSYGDCLRDL